MRAVGDALHEGVYVVTKVLRPGVFRVRPREGDGRFIARELTPPEGMADSEVELRRGFLENLMPMLTQLDHPGLAHVVDHFPEGRSHFVVLAEVEGVPLDRLQEMCLRRLPWQEVASWGLSLARALAYLHARPRPFRLGRLRSRQLLVTPDDSVVVVDFGLDRVFHGDVGDMLTTEDVAEERVGFAEVLGQLFGSDAPVGIQRWLMACSSGRPTFYEVGEGLQRVLDPPPARVVERFRVFLVDYRRLTDKLLAATLGQPLVRVGAFVLVVLLVSSGGWWVRKPAARPAGESVYVTTGSELVGLSVTERRPFTELGLTSAATGLAAAGERVWTASPGMQRLEGFDGPTHQPVAQGLERAGSRVLAAEGHTFVSHPELGRVSLVGAVTRTLPVGAGASEMAYSDGILYVACPGSGQVWVVQVEPFRVLEPWTVPGARAVAVARDRVLVAGDSTVEVRSLSGSLIAVVPARAHRLVTRPGRREVWALGTTGLVQVIDAEGLSVRGSVRLPCPPADGVFCSLGREFWVSLPDQDAVGLVGADSRQLMMTVKVGDRPGAMAVVGGP